MNPRIKGAGQSQLRNASSCSRKRQPEIAALRNVPRLGPLNSASIAAVALSILALAAQPLLGQPVLLRIEPEATDHQSEQQTEPAELLNPGPAGEAESDPPLALVAPREFNVETFAGRQSVRGYAADAVESIYALILSDSLIGEDWNRVEAELAVIWRELGQRRLRLAVARESRLRLSGPFSTESRLRAAVRSAKPADSSSPFLPNDSAISTESVEGVAPQGDEAPTGDDDQAESTSALLATVETVLVPAIETRPRLYEQIGEAASVLGCEWRSSVLLIGRLPSVDLSLMEHAGAYLSGRLRAEKVRFSFLPVDGFVPAAADWAARLTGGSLAATGSEFVAHLDLDDAFVELEWSVPRPAAGFHVYGAAIRDSDSGAEWSAPSSSSSPGWQLPPPSDLDDLFALTAELSLAVHGPNPSAPEETRSILARLRELNPGDEGLLQASAVFHERAREWDLLAKDLNALSAIRPLDPSAFANLGDAHVRLENWPEAEQAFLRFKELQPASAQASEALGRVYVRQGRFDQALEEFRESLELEPSNRDLWFRLADTALEADRPDIRLSALRSGLAVPPAVPARRAELIRMLLDSDQPGEAVKELETASNRLPDQPDLAAKFAQFWEELQNSARALEVWDQISQSAPAFEPAPVAMARIHLEQGRTDASSEVARTALQRLPESVSLHKALASAFKAADRQYDLRTALREAVQRVPTDAGLLEWRARVEDRFGRDAPLAYRSLAERLSENPSDSRLNSVIERGFVVSLREDDLAQARWFSERSTASVSEAENLKLLEVSAEERKATVVVPGGLAALGSMSNANSSVSPAQFFQEYCRPVVYASTGLKERQQLLSRRMGLYFETVRDIVAMRDSPGEGDAFVTLSAKDSRSLRSSRKVLGMLGWRVVGSARKGFSLRPVESQSGAERQEVALALGVDEIGIQDALAAGEEYKLRIKMESAPVAFGEETWASALYAGEALVGGFAEAVVRRPEIGAVYIGLTQMHPEAARALINGIGLKRLVSRFSMDLLMHGSSMSIENGSVAVPGGPDAEPHWLNLVGARPSDTDGFLLKLLQKDEGHLLGYFAALGQVDLPRQSFFTQSGGRIRRFYELYKSAPEFRQSGRSKVRESPFTELLRQLPLAEDGHVKFPGGAEIWMVAKGAADPTRLARRASRRIAPQVEDELLARIARTKFDTVAGRKSQVTKFLATSRIDQQRERPLDALLALYIAQSYGTFEPIFPYFLTLTGLDANHFKGFLAFANTVERIDSLVRRSHLLGLFHAFAEILCIAQTEGVLSESQAAELFGSMCLGLAKADRPANAAEAAVDVVQSILEATASATSTDDVDREMRRALGLNSWKARESDFLEVLELQDVPSLSSLLDAWNATADISGGEADLQSSLAELDVAIKEIPAFALAKDMGFQEEKKRLVSSFETLKLAQAKRNLDRAAARRKVRLPELQRICYAIRDELVPQMAVAVAGIVYAYYLRASDLPVAEDPLFLRKHEYYNIKSKMRTRFFPPSDLKGIGEPTGAYTVGGFADFPIFAGNVAKFGLRVVDPDAEALAVAQLASLRSTRWHALREADVRRFAMTVLLGREMVVRSAVDKDIRSALRDAIAGRLSVSRTQILFRSLESRRWGAVWESLSLSDLSGIGQACLESDDCQSMDSPVLQELVSRSDHGERSNSQHSLGSVRIHAYNHSRPQLWLDAPYEHFEGYFSAVLIAERTAELKLYLAQASDFLGVSPERLAPAAESIAKRVLATVQMGDIWDWRSVVRSFASASHKVVAEEISQ